MMTQSNDPRHNENEQDNVLTPYTFTVKGFILTYSAIAENKKHSYPHGMKHRQK